MSTDPETRRLTVRRLALALLASGLLAATSWLPFWKMSLVAPQYPGGLYLTAYGTEVTGDLREINIINHYVGMEHISSTPAPEMGLFPVAVTVLAGLCWLALFHRRLRQLAALAIAVMPFIILADLQMWLHRFGRNLDPTAPLRVEPFTPLALGLSQVGNFRTTAWVSWGFWCFLAAAAVVGFGLRASRRHAGAQAGSPAEEGSAVEAPGGDVNDVRSRPARPGRTRRGTGTTVTAAVLLALLAGAGLAGPESLAAPAAHGTPQATHATAPAARAAAEVGAGRTQGGPGADLQALIDAAPAGGVVEVPGGVWQGPVTIPGPLTVRGVGRPVVDGGGEGSVVTISGDGVVFEGFRIRNSGRNVTAEAAGIKASGSRHVIRDNLVEQVYFGIHLENGGDNVVAGNVVRPGRGHGDRPGHALSLWYQVGTRVVGNDISDARDGIYLSFADDLVATGNRVHDARYGVHSMYSKSSTFVDNVLEGNLLGAALMYSDDLHMRCNRIAHHRRGVSAYGVLLKDIDNLVLEDNTFLANRVAIYADNTPLGPGRESIIRRNAIIGHDTALVLQSNVALVFTENLVSANLVDVRSEGRGLSAGNRWSYEGRGNWWDGYQGYDADGDGIGDLPYRYELVMNELLRRSPLTRAFVYTPAAIALERAARLFPVYRPDPLVVDSHPLIEPPGPECGAAGDDTGTPGDDTGAAGDGTGAAGDDTGTPGDGAGAAGRDNGTATAGSADEVHVPGEAGGDRRIP